MRQQILQALRSFILDGILADGVITDSDIINILFVPILKS